MQMPFEQDKDPLLVVWSEAFLNLNDADSEPCEGMDRWRNFVGVSVPVAKGVMLEPGYLNQAVFRQGEDRLDHIASMPMFYRV